VGYDISYDQIVGWDEDLRLLTERVAGSLFTRPEPRATADGRPVLQQHFELIFTADLVDQVVAGVVE
jgi:hypothetical protein